MHGRAPRCDHRPARAEAAGDPHHSNGGHCLSSSGCLLPKMDVCDSPSSREPASLLAVCAVAAPASAQGACTTSVTRASAVASIPSSYLALYQKWGSAYGVPWQLLAAVGSVESRHGRDAGAYVPHTRGVLGPMQFQAGSNKAAQTRRLGRRPGLRRHLGHLAEVLGPSALPHGRPRRRDCGGSGQDRRGRRRRAPLAARPVALQRAALLPQDRAAPRRALRHELRLRAARAVRAGFAHAAGSARRRRLPRGPSRSRARWPRRPRACSRPTPSRSRPQPPTISPTASPTGASSACWPGSRSATRSSSRSSRPDTRAS